MSTWAERVQQQKSRDGVSAPPAVVVITTVPAQTLERRSDDIPSPVPRLPKFSATVATYDSQRERVFIVGPPSSVAAGYTFSSVVPSPDNKKVITSRDAESQTPHVVIRSVSGIDQTTNTQGPMVEQAPPLPVVRTPPRRTAPEYYAEWYGPGYDPYGARWGTGDGPYSRLPVLPPGSDLPRGFLGSRPQGYPPPNQWPPGYHGGPPPNPFTMAPRPFLPPYNPAAAYNALPPPAYSQYAPPPDPRLQMQPSNRHADF